MTARRPRKRCRRRRRTLKASTAHFPFTHHACHRHNLTPPFLAALTFWYPSTPSQRERVSKRSPASCSSIPQHAPAPHSPPPTKRSRRDVAEAVPPAPTSAPAAPVSRYRRARGSSPPAINAEFEINPVANAGVPFAFDEVVRGRRHRHAMGAGECEECRDVRVPLRPIQPNLNLARLLTGVGWGDSGTPRWDRCRPGSRRHDGARSRRPRRRPRSSRPSAIRRLRERVRHLARVPVRVLLQRA